VQFSPLIDRIAGRGAGAWSIHMEAARLRDQGQDVIFLTVGNPDRAAREPDLLSPTGTPAAVQRLPG
jgi:arginine:pyruvate transaminase